MRRVQFQNGEYYHVYNRGIDKRKVFHNSKDYIRFIEGINYFNSSKVIGSIYNIKKEASQCPEDSKSLPDTREKIVDIICYALLPNHFHFLLKQREENGVSKFMNKVGMGYTRYFNNKYNRAGSLFQGAYKVIPVKSNNYLLQLSCYINGNPEIHKISIAKDWTRSSYKDYLDIRNGTLCDKEAILKDFNNTKEYQDLVSLIIKDSSQSKDEVKNIY